MPKYIDADALKEEFLIEGKDVYDDMYERWGASQELIEKVIDSIPAADVEPVRHGRWIHVTNGRGGFECNLCSGYAASYQSGSDYLSAWCPNCGSKMDKEADNV